MFGIGEKSLKERVNEVDLSKSNDFKMLKPRYEYTVKVFEEGDTGQPLTSIQKGIKANSDQELHGIYKLSEQRIQILEKREINPPQNIDQPQTISTSPQPQQVVQIQQNVQQQSTSQVQKPAEQQIKYFSGGGIDFKIVGDDVYQKQWVRATKEDCAKIRIINDTNNKIVELKGKHIELLNWVKVESTDKDEG